MLSAYVVCCVLLVAECLAWSGSKLFATILNSLNNILKKLIFEKKKLSRSSELTKKA